ncbi:DUF3750 domain-containing protein [Ciceribacter sp. L1K23]|uniref:DUF3750 domain-containing protein n=1 Tax=Ciceribacter sp. L1K23 TaxID=2820276 RepID=UPI001B80EB5E|nr:DUF3750 domain-containing protein [Ciceribacter sp. L1K23]MBR0556374.1 DUF3750 domain-containing protein [Ciceribacter sp. L1K23]
MRFLKRFMLVFFVVFLLPTLVSAGLWMTAERPANWSSARWSSSGMLPAAHEDNKAAIYVMSAKTGGLKGAVASHAWIVTKTADGDYQRYDKVGWGSPIRRNHRPADAFWYSNSPEIVVELHGATAEALIPKVEKAIADYPFAMNGGYHIYPGPNSNTFVAHVLRSVPELGAVLPAHAVGRDYRTDGSLFGFDADGRDFHFSVKGLAGFAIGARSGLEVHLLGLVAGIDVQRPGIKVPALGTIGL